MTTPCKSWWRNCALEADGDIVAIDAMEDGLAPLGAEVTKIRELISTLELCHHKADRWVDNIIEAIGAGETTKGLGSRKPGQSHPAETVWQNACAALSAWCAGCPSGSVDLTIGSIASSEMLACLGSRSPLKEWQVHRVIERVRSLIHWPQSDGDPTAQYAWLLLSAGEYECDYLSACPEQYKEHEGYWLATVRTIMHDTNDGAAADLPLGLAIDMLWPCHRTFVENLRVVLEAIGGKLDAARPFAACARNMSTTANRERMEVVCKVLRVFCGLGEAGGEADAEMLAVFGEPTETKRWLAASLDKTIRMQLDPPAELQALSAMEGPAWIRQ